MVREGAASRQRLLLVWGDLSRLTVGNGHVSRVSVHRPQVVRRGATAVPNTMIQSPADTESASCVSPEVNGIRRNRNTQETSGNAGETLSPLSVSPGLWGGINPNGIETGEVQFPNNPEGIESFSEGLGRPTALPWYQTIPTLKPTLKGLDIPLLPNPEGIESFSEGLARPRAYPGKPTPTTQSPTLKGLDIPLSLCLNRSPRSLSIPYSRPRTAAHSCEIAPCAKNSIVTSGAFSPTMNAKPSPLAEQKTMFIYSPVSPGFVTRPPSSKNSNAGLRFGSKQRDRAWTILPGKADTGFSRSVFRRSLASETTFSARKNTIARSPSKRNICDSLNDTRWRLMNGIFGIDPTLSGLKNDFGAAFSRVGPRTGQPFAE